MREYKKIDFSSICNQINLDTMSFLQKSYVVFFNTTTEPVRYNCKMSQSDYQRFNEFEKDLFEQFWRVLQIEKTKKIYVYSYDTGWMKSNYYDISKINTKDGAMLIDEKSVIEALFKNALRYRAFPVFVNSDLKITIIPTDHLDLFIACESSLDDGLINQNKFKLVRQQ